MSECPYCKAEKADTDAVCPACKEIALGAFRQLLTDGIRETIRLEMRDRDVVELKTAQIAASKIIDWAKPFGYAATLAIALLGFFGIKSYSDINHFMLQAKGDLEMARADLAQAHTELAKIELISGRAKAESAEIDVFRSKLAALNGNFGDLEKELRLGTVYNRLTQRSKWTTNFDFAVKGAFVVPVDHFENIKGIEPIDPQTDIRGTEVTYSIRKKQPDAVVGVRIVAWGFGRTSDLKPEQDRSQAAKPSDGR